MRYFRETRRRSSFSMKSSGCETMLRITTPSTSGAAGAGKGSLELCKLLIEHISVQGGIVPGAEKDGMNRTETEKVVAPKPRQIQKTLVSAIGSNASTCRSCGRVRRPQPGRCKDFE
jgi:hypothetical protein